MENKMTKEELASNLWGREYGNEITPEEVKQAKENGLVVVCGYSDDNVEFQGAISEEIGCWDGGKIFFNKDGSNFTNENGEAPLTYMTDKDEPEANMIEAVWCPTDPDCSWAYKTEIPHAKFHVMEDGSLYCVGIVFSIDDLK